MQSLWLSMLGVEIRKSVGDYEGRFATAGDGPPLLLLHGQGGHLENFGRNIARLASERRVLAPDCVWHGLGPQPPFNVELVPTYVDQVRSLISASGLGPTAVLGQSMGAWTAMRLAIDHPQLVSALILVNPQGMHLRAGDDLDEVEPAPGPDLAERQLPALLEPTMENVRRRLAGLFGDPAKLDEEAVAVRKRLYEIPVVNESLRRVLRAYMAGSGSPAWRHQVDEAQLSSIRCPTLLLWGERNLVAPAAGERMAREIPDATLRVAPGAGHWLHYEASQWHDREVLEFLDAVVARG